MKLGEKRYTKFVSACAVKTARVCRFDLTFTRSLSDLTVFHTYTPGAGPDGIAFGKSGNLYVALAGYSQISVLAADGSEQARYSGPAQNPADPDNNPLPWANPANIAFDKNGSLLVTNHASLTGLPDPSPLFAVFDVYVNDRAGKLFKGGDDGDD